MSQRFSVDLVRYPQSDPLWRISQLLRTHCVDVVIDVGANDGGYAAGIRKHGYRGRVLSFEPLQEPLSRLRQKAMADPMWDVIPYAVGDEETTVTINVAGNAGASSSVLPMLDRHREAAPQAAYIGTEEAQQRRLDDILPKTGARPEDRLFLKVDVQGYERAVLDGGKKLLGSGQLIGLQMELSFVPLYDGAMTWREGFKLADDLGLTLMALEPGFTDQNGQMLQADAVFLSQGSE